MQPHQKTRPARRAAPAIGRAGALVFSDLARKTRYVDPTIADNWPAIAGERLASLARPGRLTGRHPGRTLELIAQSSAAAAEIQMLSGGLIARLNAALGPNSVSRITISQSPAKETERPAPAGDETSPLGSALASFRAAVSRRNNPK